MLRARETPPTRAVMTSDSRHQPPRRQTKCDTSISTRVSTGQSVSHQGGGAGSALLSRGGEFAGVWAGRSGAYRGQWANSTDRATSVQRCAGERRCGDVVGGGGGGSSSTRTRLIGGPLSLSEASLTTGSLEGNSARISSGGEEHASLSLSKAHSRNPRRDWRNCAQARQLHCGA